MTHLYLQNNSIKEISGLQPCTLMLRFLVLRNNRIEQVSGIAECANLELLDLSGNRVIALDLDAFPQSIEYLHIKDNPCADAPDARLRAVFAIKSLVEIDDCRVTRIERMLARQTFGGIEEMTFDQHRGANGNDDSDNGDDEDEDGDENEQEDVEDNRELNEHRIQGEAPGNTSTEIANNERIRGGLSTKADVYDTALSSILERSRQRQSEASSFAAHPLILDDADQADKYDRLSAMIPPRAGSPVYVKR
ncbi:Leucine-rich repeat-containing protein 46 [Polyrhizophydium stewartii]|uniref:Leucine-rich repeat-containing protein 46 n=1 Tax=Polyrhizophydium stewartii TaxID=2732419 RepID=A0ABR4N9P6_9FUNG